jgi:hypothetical protein
VSVLPKFQMAAHVFKIYFINTILDAIRDPGFPRTVDLGVILLHHFIEVNRNLLD